MHFIIGVINVLLAWLGCIKDKNLKSRIFLGKQKIFLQGLKTEKISGHFYKISPGHFYRVKPRFAWQHNLLDNKDKKQ